MKRTLTILLALAVMCLAAPALADVSINGYVGPGGMYADTITIELDGPALANYYYEYQVEVESFLGAEALTVYRADYVGNTVTLHVDEFSADSTITVKCIDTYVPAEEDAGSAGSAGDSSGDSGGEAAPEEEAPAEEKIVFSFEGDQVKVGNIYLEDQFTWGSRSFRYTKVINEAVSESLEQEYVYRLYIPENTDGPVPLVITFHGSGECGDDGKLMLTANGLNMCWADPAWQAGHPCYVLAIQCPSTDFANVEPQRSEFVDELYQLVKDMREELNPSKVYLATLSMGSRLAFHLLDLHPDVAIDAGLLCCGRADEADISDVTAPALYLVHDSNDPVNKTELGIAAYNTLVEAGHPNVRFTLSYMGYGHGIWSYVYDVDNPEFMEWLFAQ